MTNDLAPLPQARSRSPWKILTAIIVLLGFGLFARATYNYYQKLERGGFNLRSFETGEQTSASARTLDQIKSLPNNPTLNGSGDDPSFGPADAPVQIVAFEDFQCPYCGKEFPIIRVVRELANNGDVHFVYRDFPLSDLHANAQKAAEAGQCAFAQGKFWEFHDVLFTQQDRLSIADLEKVATIIGLDAQLFNECLESGEYEQEVLSDFADGVALGVAGTPTFFFNGNRVSGVISLAGFQTIIDHFKNQ